ncbi:hypothetical protein B9Z19DRAFT_1068968 [Tuber borchii]|uniref:Uncharacterized protein n=1 Tax=Tuber borchii TaxID=42251 RepID=A0A2T6ZDI8_TUBBO|nr:hypothetical protein B9Z19DRAFT_1068968 [Tuber borchii]
MGNTRRNGLRTEAGKKEIADTLHSRFNHLLKCPGCDSKTTFGAAFNKDAGGTADATGRLYRRFKCRARDICGKTLGVTEFVKLCHKLPPTASSHHHSAQISSDIGIDGPSVNQDATTCEQESTTFVSHSSTQPKDYTRPSVIPIPSSSGTSDWNMESELSDNDESTLRKRGMTHLTHEMEILRELLWKSIHNGESMKIKIGQLESKVEKLLTAKRSADSHQPLSTIQSKVIQDNATSTNVESMIANQQPAFLTGDESVSDSGISPIPYINRHEIPSKVEPILPQVHNRSIVTTALYVSGIPFMTIKDIKNILASAPINLQRRDICNLSWIDRRIVEILVNTTHAQKIKNRIGKYSEYIVKSDFDPLSPESFHWDGNIQPESQEAILKRNFVMRLSASVGSTTKTSTRQHIIAWANHRGIGPHLQQELNKQGIIFNAENETAFGNDALNDSPSVQSVSRSKQQSSIITTGASKFTKRKLNVTSDDSIESSSVPQVQSKKRLRLRLTHGNRDTE